MVMAVPMVLHDQKSHATAHLNCLDLTNVILLLTVLLELCDAGTGTNNIT